MAVLLLARQSIFPVEKEDHAYHLVQALGHLRLPGKVAGHQWLLRIHRGRPLGVFPHLLEVSLLSTIH